MKKEPFFSVIVPEHNSEEFMDKGLDSIRSQTFQDYQLIIVCDKCTDHTAVRACNWLRPGTRDRLITTEAGRCAAARNAGLDAAEGKWILFMDDDDYWMDEKAFELIEHEIRSYGGKLDILAFGFYWKEIGYRMNSEARLYTAVWNKAWKKEFIDRIGARFPDWAHSDDEGFSRITHKKASIRFFEAYLYYYNFMREGSLTWQIENRLIDGTIPPEE